MFLPQIATFCIVLGSTSAYAPSHAFSSTRPQRRRHSSSLFGIHEWRDQTDKAGESWPTTETLSSSSSSSCCGYDNEDGVHDNEEAITTPPTAIRELPIHLMNSNQVALQGDTLYLQFTKDDEVKLFQQALDYHEGVFGLGFVPTEDDIFYDTISLVEVIDYNMMGDAFGIFLSVQVVGRAKVWYTEPDNSDEENQQPQRGQSSDGSTEHKEPLRGVVSEIHNREERVTLTEASQMGAAIETLIAAVCNAENKSRMLFGEDQDRWDRYREAYQAALESDTHGYTYSSADHHRRGGRTDEQHDTTSSDYSWRELNAISWAIFSTSSCLKQDEPYRLAALDNDCLTNRLQLATYWLSDVLAEIKQAV